MATHHFAQAAGVVVMVRPHVFTPNPETACDNAFQVPRPDLAERAVADQARGEFDAAVAELGRVGVVVHAFDDDGSRQTPDSVFPNNWVSTHHGGRIAIYPMFAPSRRRERRADIVELLKRQCRVQEVVDYSGLENDNLFLEGTGAMIFDHIERVAYVGNSNRANPIILERFCTSFGYEPMAFDTADPDGKPIYHTNVIMTIATDFALVCLAAIADHGRRAQLARRLADTGRDVIDISWDQVVEFAGNALELAGTRHRVLALSQRALAALTPAQRATIEQSAELLPLSVPTMELAGWSVRCMLAGIHLTRR